MFTVIDTYPIELIFPIREGRSQQQIGKNGLDKGWWTVGIKLCWILNKYAQVVAWDWDGMNVRDQQFLPMIEALQDESIVFSAYGLHCAEGVPHNLNLCAKGTWNERMFVETAFSMVTIVCDLKRIRHRLVEYIATRLAYVGAMFNVVLALFHDLHPDAHPMQMSVAEFSL